MISALAIVVMVVTSSGAAAGEPDPAPTPTQRYSERSPMTYNRGEIRAGAGMRILSGDEPPSVTPVAADLVLGPMVAGFSSASKSLPNDVDFYIRQFTLGLHFEVRGAQGARAFAEGGFAYDFVDVRSDFVSSSETLPGGFGGIGGEVPLGGPAVMAGATVRYSRTVSTTVRGLDFTGPYVGAYLALRF